MHRNFFLILIGCFTAILYFTQVKSSMSTSVSDFVHSKIQQYPVVVFSKSYCPYCRRAKELLSQHSVNFESIELDIIDDGPVIQKYLGDITGQTTVPNVFIGGKSVGGCDKLVAASKDGSLKSILTNAQVSFQVDRIADKF